MILEIIEFNKKRNEFKYDEQLEIDMWTEEVREFFDATTTAERIDSILDCQYVKIGTMCKLAYSGKSMDELPYNASVLDLMINVCQRELGDNYLRVINKAEEIVCEINALKVSKLDENGKVIKQANLRNATDEIASMIAAIKVEKKAEDVEFTTDKDGRLVMPKKKK